MENLDFDDFATKSEFRVTSMDGKGLLARANGSLSVRARKVKRAAMTGTGLGIGERWRTGRSTFPSFPLIPWAAMRAFRAIWTFRERSRNSMRNGKVNNIKSREVLEVFQPRTHIIKGTWLATGP
jgi:hypothetical protein